MVSEGVEFITPVKGLNILSKLMRGCSTGLNGRTTQAVVLPVVWEKLIELNPAVAQVPLLAEIVEELAGENGGQAQSGLTANALLEADPDNHQSLLEAYLAQKVAKVLMLRPDEIDLRLPITMLGFDSLMAVTVRNQIEKDLDIALPVVKLIEGNSVSALATLLGGKFHAHFRDGAFDRKAGFNGTEEGMPEITDSMDPEEALALLETINELSDDQVNALLKKISSTQVGEDND